MSIRSCGLVIVLVVTQEATAQKLLFEHYGRTGEVQLAPVRLPDIDGDGVPEFSSGGAYEDGGGSNAGAIHVLSGRTQVEIAVLYGEHPGDRLYLNSRTPDLDGDGIEEFLASAYFVSSGSGAVYAYSGSSLSLLKRLDGDLYARSFGALCGGLGDLDADGQGDFFITDPSWYSDRGRVFVYSS